MASSSLLYSVGNKQEAMDLYKRLEAQEEALGAELDKLLDQQTQMDVQISSFTQIIPNLDSLHSETQLLSSEITRASNLATSISNKVRILDTAKRNVFGALKRVDNVIDLKNCVDGVKQSMTVHNYEEAANHIRRYLDLDESILIEQTTDNTSDVKVASPVAQLKSAEIELRFIVRDKLSKAISDKDKSSIERFAKLFPLLNLHEEGIELLTKHINSEIREFSEMKLNTDTQNTGSTRAGVIYADILMVVYEMIARQFEVHLTVIEHCYGKEWICSFISKIQVEVDKQVENIVNHMREDRMLEHKTQTIAIALNSRHTVGAIRPDPKELDTLLTELSLCSSRTELYFKFVTKKALSYSIPASDVSNILKGSETNHKIQEIISWYTLIENYFMRETLAKAVSIDHVESNELISSLPDDAFFVFQKSLKRAFSSANVDGACAMINNTSTLLLKEFKEHLKKNITDQQTQSNNSGGGLDLSDLPSMFQTSSSKSSLPKGDNWKLLGVSCCNIEVSCLNLKKLIKQLQNEINLLVADIGDSGKAKLDSCLAELCSTTSTLKEIKIEVFNYIITQLMLPDVLQIIDKFSSTSHIIDEDQLNEDDFVQRLAISLSHSLDESKLHLLPDLYEELALQFVTELNVLIEKQIYKSSFNQLGGVRLDHNLRQIISYLSNKIQHPIRDRFTRVMQIATILSLERVNEVIDYWSLNSGPASWNLTSKDIKQVLKLRKDFKSEDIDKLKFSQI